MWFKKQRYHCVYEYPKEIPISDCQGQASTTWEPTSYAGKCKKIKKYIYQIFKIKFYKLQIGKK